MKKILLFASIALLAGCLTPKKMDGWIEQHEGGFSTKLKTSDYITFKTPEMGTSELASVSQKGKSKFLPLLFYWMSERSIQTKMNPYIPVRNLTATLLQAATKAGLQQKLNGQKLELSLSKVPTGFTFTDRYHLIYLILYKIDWSQIYIAPERQDLVITYRLTKDNATTKTGSITVTDPSKNINLKFLQSARKMTFNYLDEYDNIVRDMGKSFVEKLITQL